MLEYKGYVTKIDFDDKLDCFVGEVVNIKDIITFQGATVQELKTELKNSIECYLAFCKQRSKSPDKPFSGKLLVRLSPDIHRKIYTAAKSDDLSVNKWVAIALQNAVSGTDHHIQN